MSKVRILFVCMGNICRSPSAEGVFTHFVIEENLQERFHIDSAGTHGYHVGNPPDARSAATAKERGYDLSSLRSRKVTYEDLEEFDYILAMDRDNYHGLVMMASSDEQKGKIQLFLEYATEADTDEVPDPYYGGAQGFEHVLDLIESASKGFLEHVKETHLQTAG